MLYNRTSEIFIIDNVTIVNLYILHAGNMQLYYTLTISNMHHIIVLLQEYKSIIAFVGDEHPEPSIRRKLFPLGLCPRGNNFLIIVNLYVHLIHRQ